MLHYYFMTKKSIELTCILDRFENSHGVLRFDFSQNDQQELVVAKRYLPQDVKEGDIIYLDLFSDKKATERRQNLARQMLEEILSGK